MAHSKHDIIAEASILRQSVGLLPTDIVGNIDEVVSGVGFELYENQFGDHFAAYCTHINGNRFAIILNSDISWNERFRRFTISHELGHLRLIQHLASLQKGSLVRSLPEYQSQDLIEREADYFAIYFLVPRQAFDVAAKGKNFTFESLLAIANHFGISVLAAAFRFVELTDLTCVLISVDAATGRIKYEKRSRGFTSLGNCEYLYGTGVPTRSNVYDISKSEMTSSPITDEVDLIDWYPDFGRRARCIESVMHLGYNNTYVVLIELCDDFDEE